MAARIGSYTAHRRGTSGGASDLGTDGMDLGARTSDGGLFSLVHGPGAVLLLAPFLLALWAVVTLVLIVVAFVRKRRTDTPTWLAFGLAVLLFGLLSTPSGVWQRLFIRQMASSPRAWASRIRRSAAELSLRGKIDSGKSFDNIRVRYPS